MNDKIKSRPLTAEDLGLSGGKPKPTTARSNKPRPVTSKTDGTSATKPNSQPRAVKPTSPNQPRDGKPAAGGNQTNQNRPRPAKPPYNKRGPGQGGGGGRGGNRSNPNNIRRGNSPRPRGGGRRPTTFMNGSFNTGSKPSANAQKVGLTKIDAGKLKIVPLGGLGQIGKNLMALEYENDIIVMDMGFTFPGEDQPGIDLIVPDITYLEERKHKIRGHVITHAHEDHVGGIPFLLPKIPAPIYAAQFAIKFIERKLEEYRLDFKPEFHTIDPEKHEKIQLGCFTVEFVRITHSIPDACLLIIDTPVGKIVNTGDWRFEPDPVDGKPSDMARIRQLGKENVLMLMCDSTNCEVIGWSPREKDIMHTLDDLFIRNYNKRIIVASFASQVNRMQLVIDAAAKAKRKLVVVGRSMLSNMELAVKLGYIKVPTGVIIKATDMNRFQPGELLVLSTGSQGEEFAALNRMGKGEHKEVKLQKDDVVILSASIIPGNEKTVWAMVDNLFRWGAYVYQTYTSKFDELGVTHTTGHAYSEEIEEMLNLVQPQYYLPIHGEYHHLVHNSRIAKEVGIPENKIFVIEDGQTLVADSAGVKMGPKVQSGEILIDGAGIGDVQEIVLKDRIAMSTDGVFTTIVTVSKKDGKLLTSPDIISRGFIYVKDNTELIENARKIVRNVIATRPPNVPVGSPIIKARMRDEVSHYLYKITQRNPIVLPVVIEV